MKYQFIEDHRHSYEVALLCKVLSVSRSSYYHWRQRKPSLRDLWRLDLVAKISELYEKFKGRYGAPRIYRELRKLDYKVSMNTVAALMAKHRLIALKSKKYKVTTDSNHNLPVCPNLLEQDFKTVAPNEVWVSDITYIETKEGWLYLAVTLDLYSRKVIGWSMDKHMKKELVLNALRRAMKNRDFEKGLIHHSDQGSQYASHAFQKTLKRNGIVGSMSRKGNCWDNAVAESFFATLKTECCFEHGGFKSREFARSKIFEYIEAFYNSIRSHSYNDYLAPEEFEAM